MSGISLALGGGGVKGIAHIGVLKTLLAEGIAINAVAGTSAGGIVGALFAAGYGIDDMLKAVARINTPHFFARSRFDKPSILGVQGALHVLTEFLGDRQFEDLAMPFACTAVDLNTSQEIILAHGSVVEAVLATIAVPGIFPPRQVDKYMLVDGGLMDPVPVALARWLAPTSPVVASCLSPARDDWARLPEPRVPFGPPIPKPILEQFARLRIGQAFQIFYKAIDANSRILTELRLMVDKPEVVVRPDVDAYGILDKVNADEMVAIGEVAARAALPEVQQALSWSSQLSRFFRHIEAPGKILENGGDGIKPTV